MLPNPAINKWEFQMKDYVNLLAWKKDVFDPKVEAFKHTHYDSYTFNDKMKQE